MTTASRTKSDHEPYIYEVDPVTGETYSVKNPSFKPPQKFFDSLLEKSGIPREYHGLEFVDIRKNFVKSKQSFQRAMNYIRHRDDPAMKTQSLYLWGPNNSGKTSVACAIGRGFLKANQSVRYVLAGDLALLFHESFSYEAHEPKQDLRTAELVDLLIIDEVFDETKSFLYQNRSKMIAAWDRMLRSRLSNGRRTIFLSNVKLEKSKAWSPGIFVLLDRHCLSLLFEDDVRSQQHEAQKVMEILDKPGRGNA